VFTEFFPLSEFKGAEPLSAGGEQFIKRTAAIIMTGTLISLLSILMFFCQQWK
jgi:hypothetical protein